MNTAEEIRYYNEIADEKAIEHDAQKDRINSAMAAEVITWQKCQGDYGDCPQTLPVGQYTIEGLHSRGWSLLKCVDYDTHRGYIGEYMLACDSCKDIIQTSSTETFTLIDNPAIILFVQQDRKLYE